MLTKDLHHKYMYVAEYVSRKSRKIEIVLEILDKPMPNLEVSLEDRESEGADE